MPDEDINEIYLNTIYHIPDQFEFAFNESFETNYPFEYHSNISEIVIAGMGGSKFGGIILKSVFNKGHLLNSVDVISDYDLPSYADEKTLVITTSYSGNTEETLSVFNQAKERGCKVIAISSGGELIRQARQTKTPFYTFDSSRFNPSNTPRIGIGYLVGATLGILSKLNLIDYTYVDSKSTVDFMRKFLDIMKRETKIPMQVSQKFLSRMPVFICAEHLCSATHIWRNFLNETAKHVGFIYEIPDMNHHFLDGLTYPHNNREDLLFVYIKSSIYNPRNQKRMEITREVTKKHGFYDISISVESGNIVNEVWELILIGCLVSFNLAKIHGVNPSSNEFVDYLKDSLK